MLGFDPKLLQKVKKKVPKKSLGTIKSQSVQVVWLASLEENGLPTVKLLKMPSIPFRWSVVFQNASAIQRHFLFLALMPILIGVTRSIVTGKRLQKSKRSIPAGINLFLRNCLLLKIKFIGQYKRKWQVA